MSGRPGGGGEEDGAGRPLPPAPASWCLVSGYGRPLPLGLSRQWAFHGGTSLLDPGPPLGRRRRPARAPIAASGEAEAGRRPGLSPLAVCPPTSPAGRAHTLPVSRRRRAVGLSESLGTGLSRASS